MAASRVENPMLPEMVKWFREQYPELATLLVFCERVRRGDRELEKRGTYGGPELILLYPNGGYSCLCVQVLNQSERNSDLHKAWRAIAEQAGCLCVTIRDLFSFTNAIEGYLINSPYE